MSTIDITREHSMTVAQAKKAATKVAQEIREAFDVEYEWDGNNLNFRQYLIADTHTIESAARQTHN